LERTIDFAAIGRVAKSAELMGVRLLEISATCDPKGVGPLEPKVELDCKPGAHSADALEIVCHYSFTVRTDQAEIAEASIKYLLNYHLSGSESQADSDLAEFARANGALHSWPFVRELLYSLTSRMGYPPYTLPTLHFKGTPKDEPAAPIKDEKADQLKTP
jgi:preprotein translocase subunit SecB